MRTHRLGIDEKHLLISFILRSFCVTFAVDLPNIMSPVSAPEKETEVNVGVYSEGVASESWTVTARGSLIRRFYSDIHKEL